MSGCMLLVNATFAVITAVICFLPAPTHGLVTLPEDNSLAKYRDHPENFFSLWHASVSQNTSKEVDYDEIWQGDFVLPSEASQFYPFEWETKFEARETTLWIRKYWWLSYVVAALYLIGLWLLPHHMKEKEPYDLHRLLVIWNFILAAFSFIGMMRTAPHLFLMIKTFGFEYTLCRNARSSYGGGPCGVWTMLFIFSKYFELIDTLFLILRKRKVGFLHWFHHCSVLLYCCHSGMWEMPTGVYFTVMNYSVHALMYFYYFLAAVLQRPLSWGIYVTILQISQMFGGIFINLAHMVAFQAVPHCDGHLPNVAAALVMYASYLYLFVEFLYKRYCKRRSAHGKPADSKKLL